MGPRDFFFCFCFFLFFCLFFFSKPRGKCEKPHVFGVTQTQLVREALFLLEVLDTIVSTHRDKVTGRVWWQAAASVLACTGVTWLKHGVTRALGAPNAHTPVWGVPYFCTPLLVTCHGAVRLANACQGHTMAPPQGA